MESDLLSKKLRFVPFDSGSSEHAERLRLQRVACGWAEDMIEPWRQAHEAGTKGIYWLVSSSFIFFERGRSRQNLVTEPRLDAC